MASPPHPHFHQHSASTDPLSHSSDDLSFSSHYVGRAGIPSLPATTRSAPEHSERQGGESSSGAAAQSTTETWIDFLQNVEGDNQGSVRLQNRHASSSAGQRAHRPSHDTVEARKRRLTAPDSPGRRPSYVHPGQAYPSRSLSTSSGVPPYTRSYPGSSIGTAIDLTTPPRRTQAALPPLPRPMERRVSDIVLPPWQPDADVARCPVCDTQFSFFYRKHHCRYARSLVF